MNQVYADLHIHIGRAGGRPIKMAAASSLTLAAVMEHARYEKGLDMIVVIDGVCPPVLAELQAAVASGRLAETQGGGLLTPDGLLIIPGSEVEVAGPHGGAAHFGCWFPTLDAARDFADWLGSVQTNPSLSSQRARTDARTLQAEVKMRGGLFVVHHAFTPHKGLYGNCVDRLNDMVDPGAVDAVELGLSADTWMADCIAELAPFTFLTNSDAHSLNKIAREYNRFEVREKSFAGLHEAIARTAGKCTANYGLHPVLGKYHRSACAACGAVWPVEQRQCACGGTRRVQGVWDRWLEVRDRPEPVHPAHRPPYVYQVPLEFIPGLGPRLRRRLLDAFGNEMAVLHRATVDELAAVVGRPVAERIEAARTGRVEFLPGGGGHYGKVAFDASNPARSHIE